MNGLSREAHACSECGIFHSPGETSVGYVVAGGQRVIRSSTHRCECGLVHRTEMKG